MTTLVAAGLVGTLAFSFLFLQLISRPSSSAESPPQVSYWLPYLGSALQFAARPYAFLAECRRVYGNFFTVLIAGKRFHFVCDVSSHAAVIKHPSLTFQGLVHAVATHAFGQSESSVGVEEVDKEVHNQWIRHLSGEGLNEMIHRAHDNLRLWMEQDKASRSASATRTSLYEFVDDIMTFAAVRSLYGEGWHVPTVQSRLRRFDAWFPYILLRFLPQWILRPGLLARDELRAQFFQFQAREGESPLTSSRRDLFRIHRDRYSTLDAASAETAMMFASVVNTVPSAFWTLAYLLTNPAALEAVKHEINTHLPRTPLGEELVDNTRWNKRMCSELKLTHSAMQEAMRLRAQTIVARVADKNCALTLANGESFDVCKGDWVAIFLPLSSLDDNVFSKPLDYQFDRFLSAESSSSSSSSNRWDTSFRANALKASAAFLPFGAGHSICPGRHWATSEIMMLVALVLQHCHIKLIRGETMPDADQRKLGIMPPLQPLMLELSYIVDC